MVRLVRKVHHWYDKSRVRIVESRENACLTAGQYSVAILHCRNVSAATMGETMCPSLCSLLAQFNNFNMNYCVILWHLLPSIRYNSLHRVCSSPCLPLFFCALDYSKNEWILTKFLEEWGVLGMHDDPTYIFQDIVLTSPESAVFSILHRDLDLWPFDPKLWSVHLCSVVRRRCKFGELFHTLQDIAC